jgi:hypothetical protein
MAEQRSSASSSSALPSVPPTVPLTALPSRSLLQGGFPVDLNMRREEEELMEIDPEGLQLLSPVQFSAMRAGNDEWTQVSGQSTLLDFNEPIGTLSEPLREEGVEGGGTQVKSKSCAGSSWRCAPATTSGRRFCRDRFFPYRF